MTKKVFLCSTFNLCEINSYLATQIFEFFKQNGFEVVNKSAYADIIIINTCGLDQERENKALSVVQYYIKKYLNKKEIIISGCLAKINADLSNIQGATTIGPKELSKFNEIFKHKLPIERIKANELNKGLCSRRDVLLDEYCIIICQGCVNNCSYCAIKKAKGYVKSKPIWEIVDEFKKGLKLGFKKFLLLADDCGSYGIDIGTDFAKLLNKLNDIGKENFKLYINNLEPNALMILYPKIDKNVFKNNIYFMNVPIQTISKRILKLMNREYDIKSLLNIAKEIKSLNAKLHLETHIIYGFPSESRKEFIDTFYLSKYFDRVFYFYYSDRKGTIIVNHKNKISKKELIYRTRLILKEEKKNSRIELGYELKQKGDIFKLIRKERIY